MILTFNFTMSYAKANSATANFEEWAAAQYATVVTTTTAVAAGAMHTQQYVLDNATEMYNTAKATWPSMSADMKSNFLSSLNQMGDGIITVGDWITAGLDALKGKFSTGESNTEVTTAEGIKVSYSSSTSKYVSASIDLLNVNGKPIYIDGYRDGLTVQAQIYDSGSGYGKACIKGNCYTAYYEANEIKMIHGLAGSINSPFSAYSLMSKILADSGTARKITLTYGGVDVSLPTNDTYNRLDNWIRERAIPNGQLRVYNPGAQAYSTDGYRLGLSADGQTLLKLPDGIPWEGTADWKQPILNTIDGTTATLDTAVGSWLDVATGQKIRDATAAEIAKALGVSLAIAEGILTRAKQEEALREQNKGEGGITGSLKNPKKAIIWTPLMMAGTAMTTKFPFSLPWDLINQLKVFDAAPQAPKFDINIPKFLEIGGQSIPLAFTLDLTLFDKVALMVRWFNVIIWDIALILILRKLLPE